MASLQRPEPEALLAEAAREGRGKLKIYLGMAPGVGKTYAMLEGARRLRAQGQDVAVGLLETHGRRETQELAADLEILPRRSVPYRGQRLEELDVDACLTRRPALLLVDELAHTNAPGSRHPKRWQDVEELLKAGIDVHSTLNVQHLEGLNDIVARITGVRVQETLPDHVLDGAHEIELVDLTPEELLARLAEGKVYTARLAGRARESFFKPGNLTALRELALRRAAERVDDQMVGYMRRHAIDGPWQAGERLLACVGADGLGTAVVRAANRLASQLQAPWVAVHVERPHREAPGHDYPNAELDEALGLAAQLQGRLERLAGNDVPGEILRYARRHNVTQVLVGRSRGGWLRELARRSVVHELVRRSEGIAIHVVSPPRDRRPRRPASAWRRWRGAGWLTSLASVAAVVGLGSALPALRSSPNVAMLFLAAVLVSAVRHGHLAALGTAVLSFLAYNFFFTDPLFTLHVASWPDGLTLLVFLAVASVTGSLAGRVRDQIRSARLRMASLTTLYDFSRRLGAAKTSDELLHAVVLRAHRLTDTPAMVLQDDAGELTIRYAWPPEDELDEASWAAARWAQKHGEPAGAGTDTLPSAPWHFRPLRIGPEVKGIFGLESRGVAPRLDLLPTLDAMLDQAAVAIERIAFAEAASRAAAAAETERFRNALLSSVSHDLRTPLTSILGSVTTLRQDEAARLGPEARAELLATIQEETERLDRFVANLLDITRLEAGALDVRREWLDVSEVVESALARTRPRLGALTVVRRLEPALPLVRADFLLLETVLLNLLENAAKHATGATEVEIAAHVAGTELVLTVTDDGAGIPPASLARLFDKFFRIERTDHTVAGTGLGLAIARGMVEVLGGRLTAESPVRGERGARFTLRLPIPEQPVLPEEQELSDQEKEGA